MKYIRWLETVGSGDVGLVGGKNSSLGEMIRALKEEGVRVPGGFATTADAYRAFLKANGLEATIRSALEKSGDGAGGVIREAISKGEFPEELAREIREAYGELCRRSGQEDADVAVRSSATAEDLPEASFAGQQDTYLNVRGDKDLLSSCRRCFASLFTDRAIYYREQHGFDHLEVALSIGVQKMVRSDKAGSGVMFSIDTETGFPGAVVIDAVWGLGENLVQGTVNPDEYVVFKPLLDRDGLVPILEKARGSKEQKMIYSEGGDERIRNVPTSKEERESFVLQEEDILQLARWACAIERHYGRPMDIEWARDEDGSLYIVQARPETVQSRSNTATLRTYALKEKGKLLVSGQAVGQAIVSAKVCVLRRAEEIENFEDGSILVTDQTDPDWVPIMKRAKGIVTDHGGRTSHAAIVSRELGIAAIVGTGNATKVLQPGQTITLSCAEGDEGHVYEGELEFEASEANLEEVPETKTRIMMNIASPAASFQWWRLPAKGIGLARMEFIINNLIKIHPMALVHFDSIEDDGVRRRIEDLTRGYPDKSEFFVDRLARGIAKIAAPQHPEPVIVRMSDFKTNEYADLIGGRPFEPEEANPMLGWRGASRYYSEGYREGFALECKAIRRVREEIGLDNVVVMIPFCRTPEEADRVLDVMAKNGLVRGEKGLTVYVMGEIPSNVILAEEFADRFDGFSIGSNDLTQLVLGVDRDSAVLQSLFDERNEAVKRMIAQLIERAHAKGCKVGLCGQGPSDHPDFAEFLVQCGIDSISLNPDSVVGVVRRIAEMETKLGRN